MVVFTVCTEILFQAIAIVSLEEQERLILEKSYECAYLIQQESQNTGESFLHMARCDKTLAIDRNIEAGACFRKCFFFKDLPFLYSF